jgi:hypothetical protein
LAGAEEMMEAALLAAGFNGVGNIFPSVKVKLFVEDRRNQV